MMPEEEGHVQEIETSVPEVIVTPMETTKKRKWWKKALIILGIFILALLVIAGLIWKAPFFLNFVTSDIPEINDAKLIPSDKPVPESENGYRLLPEFREKYDKANEIKDFSEVRDFSQRMTDENLDEYLTVYSESLQIYVQIADEKYFRYPGFFYPQEYRPPTGMLLEGDFVQSDRDVMPSLSGFRKLTYLSLLKAEREFNNGNDEIALRHTFAPLLIAQKMEEPNTHLLQLLVSIAMQGLAYDFIKDFIDAGLLNASSSARMLTFLEALDDAESTTAVNTMQFEYLNIKNGLFADLETYAEGGRLPPENEELFERYFKSITNSNRGNYHLRPNEFIQLHADFFTAVVEELEKGCPFGESREAEAILEKERNIYGEGKFFDMIRMHLSENVVGRILFSSTAASLSGAYKRKCESLETRRALIKKLEVQ